MATTVGAPIRLTASFTDATGTLVDPTAVTLWLNLPDGTSTSLTAVKDSTGKYHYDYTPAQVGVFDFWFAGTGANAAVQPVDIFTVQPLSSTALISLADAREHLNKAPTSKDPTSSDDSEIRGFIASATDVVNAVCGYSRPTPFIELTTAKWNALTTPGNVYASIMVRRLPLLTLTSITPRFYGTAFSLTGVQLDNTAGIIYLPMNTLSVAWGGPVDVAYVAGRATVPTVLQEACRIIVQGFWETQRGPSTGRQLMGGDDMVTAPGSGQLIPGRALEMMERSPYYAAPSLA